MLVYRKDTEREPQKERGGESERERKIRGVKERASELGRPRARRSNEPGEPIRHRQRSEDRTETDTVRSRDGSPEWQEVSRKRQSKQDDNGE